MALTYSKNLNVMLNKSKTRNILAALPINLQKVLSVVHYSDDTKTSPANISRVMQAYLERVAKYDEFMKEQLQEFNRGKEFLAGMMGRSSKEMTQKDVDEAIEYLFPSALFVPKSRPMMKPPEEIFEKEKKAVFDYSGRPFHFLFYTSKPNYSQYLHEAASKLEELNILLYKKQTPPKPLSLFGGRWINQKELEEKLKEKLYVTEYDKFIEVFKKLAEHPFSLLAETLIKTFWIYEKSIFDVEIPKTTLTEDGIEVVTINGTLKKRAIANVKMFHPGSGRISINNLGLDYFFNMQCREQFEPQKRPYLRIYHLCEGLFVD